MRLWSLRGGILWILVVIAIAVVMPPRGSWTIDDSVKRIAAENGEGLWREFYPDGELRSSLANPSDFAPLMPPFAERRSHGFAFGFSPWSRALISGTLELGQGLYRFAPALIAVLLWIMMEMAGISLAYILLPLTFYALVPWEHGLSLCLSWPAIWQTLKNPSRKRGLFFAGMTLGGAVALRIETSILAAALVGFLLLRTLRDRTFGLSVLVLGFGALMSLLGFYFWHHATSTEPAFIQWPLNRMAANGYSIGEWIISRWTTAYGLLFRMDGNGMMSALLIAGLLGGIFLFYHVGEKKAPWVRSIGLLLAVGAVLMQAYRIWTSPLPPLSLMAANSLLAACPWVLLSLLPPYRGRNALWIAVAAVAAVIVMTPVWEGVHWGPRLLLFTLPLFAIDLHQTHRNRGKLFALMIVLTAISMVNSAALVWARTRETAEHVRLVEPYLKSPVICPTMSLCTDLAPLWPGREFFTARNPRELQRLFIELRSMGVDTVWLHLDAKDPLYVQAFPEAKPVYPYRMTVSQARALYRTFWRTFELVINPRDTLWADVLQKEAGRLLIDNRPEDALKLQLEAVDLTPNAAQRHHNLALIYHAMGNVLDARQETEFALSLDSSLQEARRFLAILSAPDANVP